MSVGIAGELNELEKRNEELDKIMLAQVEDGDVAARNRRRKGQQQAMVVDNSETKRLVDSLSKFRK